VSNSVSHIKEEHKLKAFKNIVFRKPFGTKMKEVPKGWRKLHNEELHHLNLHPILFGLSSEEGEMVERVPQEGHKGELHGGCLCGNLTEKDNFEDLGVNGTIILRET